MQTYNLYYQITTRLRPSTHTYMDAEHLATKPARWSILIRRSASDQSLFILFADIGHGLLYNRCYYVGVHA